MKINEDEWNITDKSKSFTYHIAGTYVSLYAVKQKGNDKFYIKAYISKKAGISTKQLQVSLDAVPTEKDVELKLDEICKDYEWICQVQPTWNPLEIMEAIKKRYTKSTGRRQSRLELISNDDKYKMWVKKEKDTFIPKVMDIHTKSGGHLDSPKPTEEEAERIVEEQMEHYNTKGCFYRNVENPRNTFENECKPVEEPQGVLDDFLSEPKNSKEFYQKLLAVKEIVDELLEKET